MSSRIWYNMGWFWCGGTISAALWVGNYKCALLCAIITCSCGALAILLSRRGHIRERCPPRTILDGATITSVTHKDGKLYAAGTFDYEGTQVAGMAYWDGNDWRPAANLN